MRMFNADGSEAEMCGNGVRCVAKYVHDHGLAVKPRLTIETGRGVLALDLEIRNGKVERVTVDMGAPILEAEKIPTTLPGPRVVDYVSTSVDAGVKCEACGSAMRLREGVQGWFLGCSTYPRCHHTAPLPPALKERVNRESPPDLPWEEGGRFDPAVTCVSMGNPHAVFYGQDVSRIPLELLGPEIENAPVFPRRINVHFVQVHSPEEATMRTWERGSGVTLACGTGACAVCVAGVLTGRTGRRLLAHLPGGDLELHWSEADDHVYMTGPAVEVFSGEWPA
jgi:diaminopimelate epimerase